MMSRKEAEGEPDLIIMFVEAKADNDGQLSPPKFVVVPNIQEDGSMVR